MLLRQHARGEPGFIVSAQPGTAAWDDYRSVISSAVTKCTVQPCSFTPAASAYAWRIQPANRASGRWMLSMRPRNAAQTPCEYAHEAGQPTMSGRKPSIACASAASNASRVA